MRIFLLLLIESFKSPVFSTVGTEATLFSSDSNIESFVIPVGDSGLYSATTGSGIGSGLSSDSGSFSRTGTTSGFVELSGLSSTTGSGS